jgi:short-subunit dehydrogenase
VEERNIFITLIAPGKVQTNFGVNKLDSKGTPFGSKSKKPVGLSSKKAAQIILRAIKKKKRQAIIAKWNDIVWLGLFLRKHFPWLYFELAKRIKA